MSRRSTARVDLKGQRWGWLEVVCRVDPKTRPEPWASRHSWWRCRCECGTYCVALGSNIVRGANKSCGCHGRGLKRTMREAVDPGRAA